MEELDLGLIYFSGFIKDSNLIIDEIEDLENKLQNNTHSLPTKAAKWHKWEDGEQFFCWQKGIYKPLDLDRNDPFYSEQLSISSKLFNPVEECLQKYFNVFPIAKANIKNQERNMHILKYEKGHYLPPHADQGISSRVLSAIVYLNDDYEGGELNFPQSKIKFKPKAGSIIFFPSNFVYVHSIDLMTSGVRYALPLWFHSREEIIESDGRQ